MRNTYKLLAAIFFVAGTTYYLLAEKKSAKKFEQIPATSANDSTIRIDLTKENRGNYGFSDAFEIIDVVPLRKTRPESRLTKIDKLFTHNSKYIVTDPEMKIISVFSPSGHYERRIGSFGEDSSQYLDITDCLLDAKENRIQVYSSASRGIISYELDGRFMSYLAIPFFGYKFAKLPSGHIFFMNNNFNEETGYNNIIQVDINGKVVGKAFHTTPSLRPAISFSGSLDGFREGILSSMPFNDTIFKIADQRYYPKYIFNLGQCAFRDFETVPLNRLNAEMMHHCFVEDGFIEHDQVLSFSFSDLKRRKTLLGYHFRDENKTITSDMFVEGSLIWFLGRPKLIDGDRIYSVFNTQLLLSQPERNKIVNSIRKDSPKLAAILDTLSTRNEHNPILVCYKKSSKEFKRQL